jgi:cold shock CspA family protein
MLHRGKKYYGILKLWNQPRMFGFLQTFDPTSGEKIDVFTHRVNFWAGHEPVLGDTYEFEMAAPQSLGKKDQAIKVKKIAGPSDAALSVLVKGQGGAQ